MNKQKSRSSLWFGIGLTIIGFVGISHIHSSGFAAVPFSDWGSGRAFEKGSYASNGERIYYLGIDHEGQRIRFRGGPHGFRVTGGSCIDCHGPDGRGGLHVMMGTGTHNPGDIRYSALVSGEHHGEEGGEESEGEAYTDEDIRRAIRQGVEPSGESMDWTMPRWKISDDDLDDLLKYLKELG
jgi:mono/diheme cytochrome c family protein